MVNDLLVLIAVGTATSTAIMSDFEEYWHLPGKFDYLKFGRAVFIAMIVSYGLVNVASLPAELDEKGWVGFIIGFAILGYGVDKARRDKVDLSEPAVTDETIVK